MKKDKKNRLYIVLFSFIFILMVLNSSDKYIFLPLAFMIELFLTSPMTTHVLKPIARVSSKGDYTQKLQDFDTWRFIFLIFFDFINPEMAIICDVAIFIIGAFIIVPIITAIKKDPYLYNNPYTDPDDKLNNNQEELKGDANMLKQCPNCHAILKPEENICSKCGAEYLENHYVSIDNFAEIYQNEDDVVIESFVQKEIATALSNEKAGLIPSSILKRKNLLNIIFSFLVFLYITLIFFHFPPLTYIIGLIILIIFFIITKKVNLVKIITREVEARPNEKISNIVMTYQASLVKDTSSTILIVSLLLAILTPMLIFIKPRIMYEPQDNGYAVRFYTFGLTNFTKATIPETHKGQKVIALRGNTFSNMPFLKEVVLSDTITEIRGQAFKNDHNLVQVKLPNNLEYLGGGAFYNCRSLTSITLPDTLKEMGGETFYNATNLTSVHLSSNLTEIRGNTFENCSSLTTITIPDQVTRIGGHAFYGASSLKEVNISENSQLAEIGSSAFRKCSSLNFITIPAQTMVNERAFKESPTAISRYTSKIHNLEEQNLPLTNRFVVGGIQKIYLSSTEILDMKLLTVSIEDQDSTWFYIKDGVTNYFNIPLNKEPRHVEDYYFTAIDYTDEYVTINIDKKVGDYNA